MKYLTIATIVAMIALLPGYSHALASKHHKERGAGQRVATNAGPNAPIPVPEPGSFVLLASGVTALGGLLARRWYVMKKRAKRPERDEQ
jgi:PEP-CTERM motif